jgi:hypothetical protein
MARARRIAMRSVPRDLQAVFADRSSAAGYRHPSAPPSVCNELWVPAGDETVTPTSVSDILDRTRFDGILREWASHLEALAGCSLETMPQRHRTTGGTG